MKKIGYLQSKNSKLKVASAIMLPLFLFTITGCSSIKIQSSLKNETCESKKLGIIECLTPHKNLLSAEYNYKLAKLTRDKNYLLKIDLKEANRGIAKEIRRLYWTLVLENWSKNDKPSMYTKEFSEHLAMSTIRQIANNPEISKRKRNLFLKSWFLEIKNELKKRDPIALAKFLKRIPIRGLQIPFKKQKLKLFKGMHAFYSNKHLEAEKILETWLEKNENYQVLKAYLQCLRFSYRRGPKYFKTLQLMSYQTEDKNEKAKYWYRLAGEYWLRGKYEKAEKQYKKVIQKLHLTDSAIDSLFALSRRIYFEQKRYHEAIATLETVIDHPLIKEKYVSLAKFMQGLYLYAADKLPEAKQKFENIETDHLGARYWKAKTLMRLGQEGEAQQIFARVYKEDTLSFYGHLSYINLLEKPLVPKNEIKKIDNFVFSIPTSWKENPKPIEFQRAEALLKLGLNDLASHEVKKILRKYKAKKDEKDYISYLSELTHRTENYIHSIVLITKFLDNRTITIDDEEIFKYYPRPYLKEFKSAIKNKHNVDLELMLAIARQESGFNPSVLSATYGYGLLQIQERTGERIAREKKLTKYNSSMLFNIQTNIDFSIHELLKAKSEVGKEFPFSVGAYNAGGKVVEHWKKNFPKKSEFDLYIDLIPYSTTRHHVRNILRNRANYYLIYKSGFPASYFEVPKNQNN